MTRQNKAVVLSVVASLVIGGLTVGAGWYAAELSRPQVGYDRQPITQSINDSVTGHASEEQTKHQRIYLIEEEKLAHDVYMKMYEKYGAQVFGNILKSEATHQNRVLALLTQREIDDPRSSEVGTFNNHELQRLYDDFIAKGEKTARDAYEVGVMIEEKDIADISKQLETASDYDVIQTLEALRRGSENHLRAFNRQLHN